MDDIHRAVVTLNRETERMVFDAEAEMPSLDASEYFFVSTRLAERFPDVWESSIVLTYHTTQPPPRLLIDTSNGDRFMIPSRGGIFSTLLRRFTVALGMSMMLFGTININLQKAILHTIQPLILAGIYYLYYRIEAGAWYMVFPLVCIVAVLIYQLVAFLRRTVAANKSDLSLGQESSSLRVGPDIISKSNQTAGDASDINTSGQVFQFDSPVDISKDDSDFDDEDLSSAVMSIQDHLRTWFDNLSDGEPTEKNALRSVNRATSGVFEDQVKGPIVRIDSLSDSDSESDMMGSMKWNHVRAPASVLRDISR